MAMWEVRPYWDTDYPSRESLAADGRSDADVSAGFREALDNAVAERLVADVEVASYLSGGINSSAVLGLAQRRSNRRSGRSPGVAKYVLSRAVRDAGIKVAFTGEGADEILGGYPPFRRDLLLYNTEKQPPEEIEKLPTELDATNQTSRGVVTADGSLAPGLDAFVVRLGWTPAAIEAFSTLAARTHPVTRPNSGRS
jgi:asparagine synthetase B (glutamine-hydrolysing)